MIARNTTSEATAHNVAELNAAELDGIVGGKEAPKNQAAGGSTSVWADIKSLMFGVDASFFD